MAIDPVCGMTVDPDTTPHRLERDGQAHFFCSRGCRERFRQHAEGHRDLAPAATAHEHGRGHETARAPAEWTCPMHPEVVRNAPGTCPICGMALEPRTPR